MAKPRKIVLGAPRPSEKDESEVRWLISYSDFMMQLVCLFILLSSVSSDDSSKAVPIAQAWREEMGVGSHFHLGEAEEDLMMTYTRYNRRIVPRFESFGLLSSGSVAANPPRQPFS